MKVIGVVAVLAVTAAPAFAASFITPNAAAGYGGSAVTVRGRAMIGPPTSRVPLDSGVEIRMGSGRENGDLIAYIPKGNLRDFPDVNALNGRAVDVTGVVEIDSGQPEIRVTSPKQLAPAQ